MRSKAIQERGQQSKIVAQCEEDQGYICSVTGRATRKHDETICNPDLYNDIVNCAFLHCFPSLGNPLGCNKMKSVPHGWWEMLILKEERQVACHDSGYFYLATGAGPS